jgi:hypothetical protein
MTEIFSLKALSAAIMSFWARSAIFFWCLAACFFILLLTLVAGAHWQLGDTPAWLAEYGTILVLAIPVLLVFAAFKTYIERPAPILSLLPLQSFCGQSRQRDGRITTQLTLHFQVTNLTDGEIMLSAIELRRPFVRRRAILQKMLVVRRPNGNGYSSETPVEPHSLTRGLADILRLGEWRPQGATAEAHRASERDAPKALADGTATRADLARRLNVSQSTISRLST